MYLIVRHKAIGIIPQPPSFGKCFLRIYPLLSQLFDHVGIIVPLVRKGAGGAILDTALVEGVDTAAVRHGVGGSSRTGS